MEILKVVFILAAVFGLGTSRVITPEPAPWDDIDQVLEELILHEKTEENDAQSESLVTVSEEATSASQKTSSHDAGSEAIGATEATAIRQRRNAEPSCLKGYAKHTFRSNKTFSFAVCHATSAHNKCGATFDKYYSRACEPSDFVVVADDPPYEHIKIALPRSCSCKA